MITYFPSEVLSSEPWGHRFRAGWYGYALEVLQEPALYPALVDGTETYRLLLLPTFTHPLVVCVQRTGSVAKVHAKRGSGRGGSDPGELAQSMASAMDLMAWEKVKSHVEASSFWSLATEGEFNCGGDGTAWIIAGSWKEHYHVVNCCCPKPSPFLTFGEHLIELAGDVAAKLGQY